MERVCPTRRRARHARARRGRREASPKASPRPPGSAAPAPAHRLARATRAGSRAGRAARRPRTSGSRAAPARTHPPQVGSGQRTVRGHGGVGTVVVDLRQRRSRPAATSAMLPSASTTRIAKNHITRDATVLASTIATTSSTSSVTTSRSRSSSRIVPWPAPPRASRAGPLPGVRPDQHDREAGDLAGLHQGRASNISSSVPTPPGRTTKPGSTSRTWSCGRRSSGSSRRRRPTR